MECHVRLCFKNEYGDCYPTRHVDCETRKRYEAYEGLVKALENIVKHQEVVSNMSKIGVVWKIATEALKKAKGE